MYVPEYKMKKMLNLGSGTKKYQINSLVIELMHNGLLSMVSGGCGQCTGCIFFLFGCAQLPSLACLLFVLLSCFPHCLVSHLCL